MDVDAPHKRKAEDDRPGHGDGAPAPPRPSPPPPLPSCPGEDLSHGQRPPADAAVPGHGVPVVQHTAPPPPLPPPLPAASARLLVPGHAAWFRYAAVHRVERDALPEWFDGRAADKTPEVRCAEERGERESERDAGTPRIGVGPPDLASSPPPPHSTLPLSSIQAYMKLRNLIVDAYRESPTTRLTFSSVRARAAADAGAALRVFSFLDHWGIVNFQAPPDAPGAGTPVAVAAGAPSSLRAGGIALPAGADALFAFPPPTVAAGVAAAAGAGAPPTLAALVGRRDRYGRAPAVAPTAGGEGAVAAAPRFVCSAMPWVDCSASRYHCTKHADVVLCPAAYAEGRFPPGCTAKDFVKVEGRGSLPAVGIGGDAAAPASDWTDSETLLLLEGVELHCDSWADVAEHVGTRSAFACVKKFLALPLADDLAAAAVEAPPTGGGVPADGHDASAALPFTDAGNPVMAQVACLAHMVGPRVAAAAAAAALDTLAAEASSGAFDPAAPPPPTAARAAAAAGLAAAAVKARVMADAEEREVVRLAATAAAALGARVHAKAAALDALETALEAERAAADASRDAAYAERRALEAARLAGR